MVKMLKHHFGFIVLGAFLITAVLGDAEWYITTDGHNYLIDPDYELTWYDALDSCASQNLSLPIFSFWKKYMALIDVLRISGGENFWIGGIDKIDKDDGCYWAVTGNQFDIGEWSSNDQTQCFHVGNYGVLCRGYDACKDFKLGLLCEDLSYGVAEGKNEELTEIHDVLQTELKSQKFAIDHLLVHSTVKKDKI